MSFGKLRERVGGEGKKGKKLTFFPPQKKTQKKKGTEAPAWVTDLLDTGYLTEVHKFSKFIHGTATLMPDLVQAVPYWVRRFFF